MPENAAAALAARRLEKARETLKAAELTLVHELYDDSANRSYYAVFHAVRALLALEGADYKRHSGVIAHFQREYVKTGKFDKKYSEIVVSSFTARQNSDYGDFFPISREEAETQLAEAKDFVHAVDRYVGTLLRPSDGC